MRCGCISCVARHEQVVRRHEEVLTYVDVLVDTVAISSLEVDWREVLCLQEACVGNIICLIVGL